MARFAALNKGIDIGGHEGQLIRATAAGTVVYSGGGLPGYGQLIILKHGENYLSAYAHNRRNLVVEGQKIKAQQVLAEMGKSGSDRVGLHFEIRRAGRAFDPLSVLPR